LRQGFDFEVWRREASSDVANNSAGQNGNVSVYLPNGDRPSISVDKNRIFVVT
jgi:hypothetical protein